MTDEDLRKQAWDFFQLQAGQRLTTFNFYIALSSLIAGGLAASFKVGSDIQYIGPLLGVLLILFSFTFWKLDSRNRELIRSAETALKYFEDKAPLADDNNKPHVAKRFKREEADTKDLQSRNVWWKVL